MASYHRVGNWMVGITPKDQRKRRGTVLEEKLSRMEVGPIVQKSAALNSLCMFVHVCVRNFLISRGVPFSHLVAFWLWIPMNVAPRVNEFQNRTQRCKVNVRWETKVLSSWEKKPHPSMILFSLKIFPLRSVCWTSFACLGGTYANHQTFHIEKDLWPCIQVSGLGSVGNLRFYFQMCNVILVGGTESSPFFMFLRCEHLCCSRKTDNWAKSCEKEDFCFHFSHATLKPNGKLIDFLAFCLSKPKWKKAKIDLHFWVLCVERFLSSLCKIKNGAAYDSQNERRPKWRGFTPVVPCMHSQWMILQAVFKCSCRQNNFLEFLIRLSNFWSTWSHLPDGSTVLCVSSGVVLVMVDFTLRRCCVLSPLWHWPSPFYLTSEGVSCSTNTGSDLGSVSRTTALITLRD